MKKRSLVTQELANAFPLWSKIRSDEQSIGFDLLNAIGLNIETIDKELYRNFDNLL